MKDYTLLFLVCLTFLTPTVVLAWPLNQRNGFARHPDAQSRLRPYLYERNGIASDSAGPQEKENTQQGNAEISGKVSDAESNDPLIGATVILEGTSLGVPTNLNGDYSIEAIPPGTYTMRVMYVGYTTRDIKIDIS